MVLKQMKKVIRILVKRAQDIVKKITFAVSHPYSFRCRNPNNNKNNKYDYV